MSFFREAGLRADEGAAAVLVAVLLMGLFGAALISIDAGIVRNSRRQLVTGTDAAALATAAYFAENPSAACDPRGINSAQGLAASLIPERKGTPAVDVTASDCVTGSGHVSVRADQSPSVMFAPVFGIEGVTTTAKTTAQWGPLVDILRVRPLALCLNDPHVLEWAYLKGTPAYDALDGSDNPVTEWNDHPGSSLYPGAGVVHRIVPKETSDCRGGVPGNWAWLDFNGNAAPNGAKAIRDWLEAGYPETITLGTLAQGDEDCRPNEKGFDDCEGKPKEKGGLKKALSDLRCTAATATAECTMFPVVIYDSAREQGSKFEYHPAAFLGVVLRGFDGMKDEDDDDDEEEEESGSEKDRDYLDLEFVHLNWDGRIGRSNQLIAVHGVQICGTDQVEQNKCDV